MPRYYFDSLDGGPVLLDEEGLELDGIEAARREALSGLADFARDLVPNAKQGRMSVHVRDEVGNVVHRATLIFPIEEDQPQTT
jgi:hypothetical protein